MNLWIRVRGLAFNLIYAVLSCVCGFVVTGFRSIHCLVVSGFRSIHRLMVAGLGPRLGPVIGGLGPLAHAVPGVDRALLSVATRVLHILFGAGVVVLGKSPRTA